MTNVNVKGGGLGEETGTITRTQPRQGRALGFGNGLQPRIEVPSPHEKTHQKAPLLSEEET